jgi:hypothetical protein
MLRQIQWIRFFAGKMAVSGILRKSIHHDSIIAGAFLIFGEIKDISKDPKMRLEGRTKLPQSSLEENASSGLVKLTGFPIVREACEQACSFLRPRFPVIAQSPRPVHPR